MRVMQVSILVAHALLLVTLLWVVTAFCVYRFGGPAYGVANGLISPENGRWLTVNLATELSFLAILSCLVISIFSSLNRRSFANSRSVDNLLPLLVVCDCDHILGGPHSDSCSHRKEFEISQLF